MIWLAVYDEEGSMTNCSPGIPGMVKVAVCFLSLALLLSAGCAVTQNRLSQKAWSQTATQEQQQQQLRADPQGDRDMLAY
jgi:hypothetical protein